MNILLIYPKHPDTFWSFKYALRFVSKKSAFPPLGLLTVAAMLPVSWDKRLVDLNVRTVTDAELVWADYVFLSAMSIQRASAKEIIGRCNALRVKVVAGGPLFTSYSEEFEGVDHLVLNEAEVTLPLFLDDLKRGTPEHRYTTHQWADIQTTPAPLWNLVNLKHYSSMNIQYSRGCPYDCEFCDITVLYGRIPRTKSKDQILAELDGLYARGWNGSVFFVDDNFIGNKKKLKAELLPALVEWRQRHRHPFTLSTEASINLSDDEELMRLMVQAGFSQVFVGIESPHEESLIESRKSQNRHRDLIACVRKMQRFGLEVQAGFIVGFDSDPASIFERLIEFIQESGIATAMVGLLNAPKGTRLYQRLLREGRMLNVISGDNTDFSLNFLPHMNREALLTGYKKIVETIYSPKQYHARVKRFLKQYQPHQGKVFRVQVIHLKAFAKSLVVLGVIAKERVYYWRLLFWSLFRRPRLFPLAVSLSIYGFHFRKVFERQVLEVK
jgi:radical SAM superfamily enzyme YgiQ (UPF0313 family)